MFLVNRIYKTSDFERIFTSFGTTLPTQLYAIIY